jgi:hypothetical protein
MLTKMPTKNADNFVCKTCDFICRKQSNYVKHLVTSKHKKLTNNENDNKNAKLFECILCSKQYFSRVGLWKHDKKCRNIKNIILNETELTAISGNTEKINKSGSDKRHVYGTYYSDRKEK